MNGDCISCGIFSFVLGGGETLLILSEHSHDQKRGWGGERSLIIAHTSGLGGDMTDEQFNKREWS